VQSVWYVGLRGVSLVSNMTLLGVVAGAEGALARESGPDRTRSGRRTRE
jgi:hypothetical protein